MKTQLLCTFTSKDGLQKTLQDIRETYVIVYNYIYILQNKSNLDELYVTYNINTEFKPPQPLEDLNTAVVGDKDTIGRCLGLKEGESIDDGIKIRVDKYDNRKVLIYDRNGKQIGFQSARSKTGPGGSMQDTIAYHKDFQKCLAKQTTLMGK